MKSLSLPIASLLVFSLASPGFAQNTAQSTIGGAQDLTNSQQNQSTVGGALYNTQVNQGYLSEPSGYQIRDIRCSEPVFEVGTTHSAYIGTTLVANYRMPISNGVCQQITQEIQQQIQLDTYLNSVKFCLELAGQGVLISPLESSPESLYLAAVCSTVSAP